MSSRKILKQSNKKFKKKECGERKQQVEQHLRLEKKELGMKYDLKSKFN